MFNSLFPIKVSIIVIEKTEAINDTGQRMTKTLKEGREGEGREERREGKRIGKNVSLSTAFCYTFTVSDDQTRDDVHKESMFMTDNNKTIQCQTRVRIRLEVRVDSRK